MTTIKGIYSLADLYEQRFAPISTLDMSKVLNTIQAYGDFLVQDMNAQLNDFTEETTKSRAIWGGAPTLAFDEVNEFGKGKPRKEILGQEVHFPLFKLSATDERSAEMQKRATAGQLREMLLAMNNAYYQRVRDEIKASIFNKAAHIPVKDWTVDNSTLNKVQPFINADSNEIPASPNGSTFTASTHQHYVGTSGTSLSTYDVNTLLSNVQEHVLGKVVLFVDGAMPASLAALSGTEYVARPPSPIQDNRNALIARASFNPDDDANNMSIGYWKGVEVVTRSWVPTGYLACLAVGGQLGKPILRRVDPAFPGMRIATELSDNSVILKEAYTYLGFGAFNRAAGAVLDSLHQTAYTNPSGLVRA
jgi:hypothetical protein